MIGADHGIVDDTAARHRRADERERPRRRAGPVGVQREGQAGFHTGPGGIHEGGAFGAEDLVAIGGAVEAHMVHQETRLHVEFLHAQNLVGARHRRVLDAVDAIVGRARVGRLDRVERNVDRVIAVAMDLHRQAEGLHFGDHLFHLGGVEVRRTLGGRVQIGLGLRPGLGLVGAVADDLDAIEREQGIADGRAFPETEAAPGRQALHVVEHHARAGSAGKRIRELCERFDMIAALWNRQPA